ncbi:hypothetical protein CEE37_11300 [candidate division LCP-89 bacterium B3_LCP]|uniref:Uncharacterized protein n=1 Tax=candidate division LCP-89 bacterium B3_LCP TaxID=2012998 RepID=A0A532UY32_UNCL8|nr:MAG: hypothetical protein CEE37_11300 [candidate division LCP-89 bacterium B3_LCP]
MQRLLLLRPDSGIYCALPPLGLLSLAAYIRHYSDHQIGIFDGVEKSAEDSQVIQAIESFQPDVIGIGSLSCEQIEAHHTANLIKELFPEIKIVLGGPYASSEPSEAIDDPAVDYVIVGEGEIALTKLLKALDQEGNVSEIKGLVYKTGEGVNLPNQLEVVDDLDEIPMPAWDLIDLERYFYNRRQCSMNLHVTSRRCVPIASTRGCVYKCTYCHNIFGKKVRARSVDKIIEEIEYLKTENGVEEVEFVDDIFNYDRRRTSNIAKRISAGNYGLKFCFSNGLKADLITPDLVDQLIEMGTFRICYVIDTGSPVIQKKINRVHDLKKTCEIINYTSSRGISVGLSVIVGFPGETAEQARITLDYAFKLKLSTVSFLILNPYPSTEIYEQAVKDGKITKRMVYSHLYSLSVNLSAMSDKKLQRMVKLAYLRYYLHPIRLWRFISTTPIHHFFFSKLYTLCLVTFFKHAAEVIGDKYQYADGKKKRSRFS